MTYPGTFDDGVASVRGCHCTGVTYGKKAARRQRDDTVVNGVGLQMAPSARCLRSSRDQVVLGANVGSPCVCAPDRGIVLD